MVWSRVKDGRGGYHQEDVKQASARNEKNGRPNKRWLHNIKVDMKEYKVTKDMAQNQSVLCTHEDKGRPITSWRRPIGEKIECFPEVYNLYYNSP